MEIHHPEKPIHSKKDFIIHMLTVILGILIALGLDGIVEWAHHRALVHEARENLALEVAANKQTIDDALQQIPTHEAELKQIVSVIQKLKRTKKLSVRKLAYNYRFRSLYSAAWETAHNSGAVSYMSYNELKHYADIYDAQQLYIKLQDQLMSGVTDMLPLFSVLDDDPKKIPLTRLTQIQQQSSKQLMVLQLLEQVGKEADAEYAKSPH